MSLVLRERREQTLKHRISRQSRPSDHAAEAIRPEDKRVVYVSQPPVGFRSIKLLDGITVSIRCEQVLVKYL